ncbi:MAG TPA: Ig-like domain-containing protein [Gillisia sp.]|nr:Ig-like domain-containing protein [Gillisia sp.]
MKFTPLLILTLFLIFSSGQSQTIISGKIININNQALFGTTVTLSPDSTATIPAYGISDANGNYNYLIHESDFRQDWFDFRPERNVEWIKEQISNLWEE